MQALRSTRVFPLVLRWFVVLTGALGGFAGGCRATEGYLEVEKHRYVLEIQKLAAELGSDAKFISYRIYIVSKDITHLKQDTLLLRVFLAERLFFATDSAKLGGSARAVLGKVAAAIAAMDDSQALFVAGHTDVRGSDTYNLELSIRRADTVARALAALGIKEAGFKARGIWRIGFGKYMPVAPNRTPAGMAQNRRVEFLFARDPQILKGWLTTQPVSVCHDSKGGDCVRRFQAEAVYTRVPGDPARIAVDPAPRDNHIDSPGGSTTIDFGDRTIHVGDPRL